MIEFGAGEMGGVDPGGEVEIFGQATLERRLDHVVDRAIDLVPLAGIGVEHEGGDLGLHQSHHLIAHGREVGDLQQLLRLRESGRIGVVRARRGGRCQRERCDQKGGGTEAAAHVGIPHSAAAALTALAAM